MPEHLVLVPGLNNTGAVFDRLRPHLAGDCEPLAVDNPALEQPAVLANGLLGWMNLSQP